MRGNSLQNKVGNPLEIIRRSLHRITAEVVKVIMDIDEREIKRLEATAIEIPMADVVSESHGKSMFPIHKLISEIAPNSFTESMVDENYEAMSGAQLEKAPVITAFVKPNETLGKVKPRPIQHMGPKGTAMASLMNKTIEEAIFRLPYFLLRGIKGTDHHGVNERMRQFYETYQSGGIASTDFGSFDSSVTDKCTGDLSKPGIRRVVEEELMNAITKKFPDAFDYQNVSSKRWRKKNTILFDALTLVVSVIISVIIRFSGDGLTSVGNYWINWNTDKTVDTVAEVRFAI